MLVLTFLFVRVVVVTNHLMYQAMITCNSFYNLIRAPVQDTGIPSTPLYINQYYLYVIYSCNPVRVCCKTKQIK